MQVIQTADTRAIEKACAELAAGNLVIYPTETCYGIAADATNSSAVTKLLEYKGDRYRQVSIAVANREMAEKYVVINEIAGNLYKNFLPGPITVISESRHNVDSRLESSKGTLGVRIPDHSFALDLIQAYGKPITATSANTSGKKEPYSQRDWHKYTVANKQAGVSLFLDGGLLEERPTSTVVDTTMNDPVILRQGELILPLSAQSFVSHSVEESERFAGELLRRHMNLTRRFPLLIALQGNLGTGKTHLTKGFAHELGIDTNIPSPTYTLMREYPYSTAKYSGTLYHTDTWRLEDPSEIGSLLKRETLNRPGNISVIEWAGKAKKFIEDQKNECAIIMIDIQEKDENTRIISYSVSTPEWS